MINISLDICWGWCGSGGCRWQDDEASPPFLSKSYKIYQTPRQALTCKQSFGIFLLLFCIFTIFVSCFFSQKGVDKIYQTPHKASPDLRLALFHAYFCNSSLYIVVVLLSLCTLRKWISCERKWKCPQKCKKQSSLGTGQGQIYKSNFLDLSDRVGRSKPRLNQSEIT